MKSTLENTESVAVEGIVSDFFSNMDTKERVLKKYPDIEERVSWQLKPFGKKGHVGLEGVLQLWRNGVFFMPAQTHQVRLSNGGAYYF